MRSSAIETTLTRLRQELQDVKARESHTGCVYLAYKQNTLSSGIYTLQSLATTGHSEYSEGICDLLTEYHQVYRKTIHQ